MDTKELQKKIQKTYTTVFGRTPLTQRLDDILGEAMELHRFTDMTNLREEAGDLLSSILQLYNECGWGAEELIAENLAKINRRKRQYLGLGRKLKVISIGGAFNMPTNGHKELATFLLNCGIYDEIWITPCAHHMFNKEMESSQHRLAMCKILAGKDKRIRVCDFEIRNKLTGETYNFVKRFLETDVGKNMVELSLAIAMDNANTCENSWVNFKELERLVPFVVVPRTGEKRNLRVNWYLKPPHILLQPEKPIIEMSSTTLREALKAWWHWNFKAVDPGYKQIAFRDTKEASILRKGLDPDILKYIGENGLYLPPALSGYKKVIHQGNFNMISVSG